MEADNERTTAASKKIPRCLGRIHERHDEECSSDCPKSALCVLMALGKYLSRK